MMIYDINTFRDTEKIYIIFSSKFIFSIDKKTFGVKKEREIPRESEEIPFEILRTLKIYRERYIGIQIYDEEDIYIILYYDGASDEAKIISVSKNEKWILDAIENISKFNNQ